MISSERPFSSIESAHAFLVLLGEEIHESLEEARLELSACAPSPQGRRTEAWRLVIYTMTRLSTHVANSRVLVNDLRTLRNLLHRSDAIGPARADT